MVVEAPAEQAVEQAVLKPQELASLLYGDGPLEINLSQLRQHFVDLSREFRRDGAIERAVAAMSDFVWPTDTFTRDTHNLHRCGAINTLIRHPVERVRLTQGLRLSCLLGYRTWCE